MKLTIDTKEDSHEEIKKAIRMLSTIVGDEHVYTNSAPKKRHANKRHANIFDSGSSSLSSSEPEPAVSETAVSEPAQNAFASMFGAVSSAPSEPEEQKEEEDKKPEIIVEY